MDRGAWKLQPMGSQRTEFERLGMHTPTSQWTVLELGCIFPIPLPLCCTPCLPALGFQDTIAPAGTGSSVGSGLHLTHLGSSPAVPTYTGIQHRLFSTKVLRPVG